MQKKEQNPAAYRTKPVSLSGRLLAIVELAGTGDTVCDVGCDHAHVPIRLLQNGQFVNAIAMDVLPGPLEKAAGNLALYGMEDRVERRLSDGLDALLPNEADTLIITGMGGRLMRGILLREPEKTASFSVLVLGPQSEPEKVRSALRQLSFTITKERLVYEDGKYYPILRAEKNAAVDADRLYDSRIAVSCGEKTRAGDGGQPEDNTAVEADAQPRGNSIRQETEDMFGPVLLGNRDPVLYEFLVRRTAVFKKILQSVKKGAAAQKPAGSAIAKAGAGSDAAQKPAGNAAGFPGDGSVSAPGTSAREKEILHILSLYQEALGCFTDPAVP